jgi:glyoxylase-like metal-dependent hydrolase (beta-lactamase superfamily II)
MPDNKPSSTKIGPFELFAVESGRFRLDGGAMFGVVPKTLWARHIECDEKNRIPMAMRCLLIKSDNTGKIYLVDTGTGTKFDEKMNSIYAVDHSHSDLVGSLRQCGVAPGDVTDIIFSHLHFDHCGGTTYYDEQGELRHRFPNAAYHVNERHLQNALNPNAREKASFLKDNIQPISRSGRLYTVGDHHTFEEGLYSLPAEGHTIGQQLPVVEADGKTVVFTADLIPTHVHIPLAWVMGYDMRPIITLEEKEAFLIKAAARNWHLFLEHDAEKEVITVQNDNGKFSIKESMKLSQV